MANGGVKERDRKVPFSGAGCEDFGASISIDYYERIHSCSMIG